MSQKKINYIFMFFTFVIFCFMMYINFNITTLNKSDDAIFLKQFNKDYNNNYLFFASSRYQNWTSRIVIEFVLTFFVQHLFLWKIVNSLVMTSLAVVPSLYFSNKNKIQSLLFGTCFFLIIPVAIIKETGWIATTTNYLWVLTAGMIAFIPIMKTIKEEKVSKSLSIISYLLMLYAVNQEQMAVLIVAFLLILAIVLRKKNKRLRITIPYFILSIGSLVYIITCPGNSARKIAETNHWFPKFSNFTIFQKLNLGYSSTLRSIFFDHSAFFAMFFLFIFVIGFIGEISFLRKFLSSLPIVIYLYCLNHSKWIFKTFDLSSGKIYPLLIIVVTAILLLLLLVFWCIAQSKIDFFIILILFLSGLGSRMIMGFSPTIWVSGNRTYLFFYYFVLLIVVFLIKRISFRKIGRFNMLIFAIFTVLLISVVFIVFPTTMMSI